MKNWYAAAGELIYKTKKPKNINEAYEIVNKFMSLLEVYGFVDSDWWSEIERDDPRFGK